MSSMSIAVLFEFHEGTDYSNQWVLRMRARKGLRTHREGVTFMLSKWAVDW